MPDPETVLLPDTLEEKISIEQLARYLGTDVPTLLAMERSGQLNLQYGCCEWELERSSLDRFMEEYRAAVSAGK